MAINVATAVARKWTFDAGNKGENSVEVLWHGATSLHFKVTANGSLSEAKVFGPHRHIPDVTDMFAYNRHGLIQCVRATIAQLEEQRDRQDGAGELTEDVAAFLAECMELCRRVLEFEAHLS